MPPNERYTSRAGVKPAGEQVLDGLEDDRERALVVERAAPVDPAVLDAALERRVRPGVALVDRNDVVVRHQHDAAERMPRTPGPAEQQAELGDPLEVEVLVHQRVELGEEGDEVLERLRVRARRARR